MEEAETSNEGLPANISPIATAYSSGSASPSVDPMELRTDANRAADNIFHLKRFTDLKRQRVIWELGVLLHQSEVDEATSVAKAKVIHLWEVLETKVGCSRSVLKAKCNYRVAVKEAKTIKALTHTTQIRSDFDITNSLQYRAGFGMNTVCELFPHIHMEGFCCVGQGHVIFTVNSSAVCQPNVMQICNNIVMNLHHILCVRAFRGNLLQKS